MAARIVGNRPEFFEPPASPARPSDSAAAAESKEKDSLTFSSCPRLSALSISVAQMVKDVTHSIVVQNLEGHPQYREEMGALKGLEGLIETCLRHFEPPVALYRSPTALAHAAVPPISPVISHEAMRDDAGNVQVKVTVAAPKVRAEHLPYINRASIYVLDRSGSMNVGNKLQQAKNGIIDGIKQAYKEGRTVCVYGFSSNLSLIVPAQIIKSKEQLEAVIALVNAAGTTGITSGAMGIVAAVVTAAKMIEAVKMMPISRGQIKPIFVPDIIFVTDGIFSYTPADPFFADGILSLIERTCGNYANELNFSMLAVRGPGEKPSPTLEASMKFLANTFNGFYGYSESPALPKEIFEATQRQPHCRTLTVSPDSSLTVSAGTYAPAEVLGCVGAPKMMRKTVRGMELNDINGGGSRSFVVTLKPENGVPPSDDLELTFNCVATNLLTGKDVTQKHSIKLKVSTLPKENPSVAISTESYTHAKFAANLFDHKPWEDHRKFPEFIKRFQHWPMVHHMDNAVLRKLRVVALDQLRDLFSPASDSFYPKRIREMKLMLLRKLRNENLLPEAQIEALVKAAGMEAEFKMKEGEAKVEAATPSLNPWVSTPSRKSPWLSSYELPGVEEWRAPIAEEVQAEAALPKELAALVGEYALASAPRSLVEESLKDSSIRTVGTLIAEYADIPPSLIEDSLIPLTESLTRTLSDRAYLDLLNRHKYTSMLKRWEKKFNGLSQREAFECAVADMVAQTFKKQIRNSWKEPEHGLMPSNVRCMNRAEQAFHTLDLFSVGDPLELRASLEKIYAKYQKKWGMTPLKIQKIFASDKFNTLVKGKARADRGVNGMLRASTQDCGVVFAFIDFNGNVANVVFGLDPSTNTFWLNTKQSKATWGHLFDKPMYQLNLDNTPWLMNEMVDVIANSRRAVVRTIEEMQKEGSYYDGDINNPKALEEALKGKPGLCRHGDGLGSFIYICKMKGEETIRKIPFLMTPDGQFHLETNKEILTEVTGKFNLGNAFPIQNEPIPDTARFDVVPMKIHWKKIPEMVTSAFNQYQFFYTNTTRDCPFINSHTTEDIQAFASKQERQGCFHPTGNAPFEIYYSFWTVARGDAPVSWNTLLFRNNYSHLVLDEGENMTMNWGMYFKDYHHMPMLLHHGSFVLHEVTKIQMHWGTPAHNKLVADHREKLRLKKENEEAEKAGGDANQTAASRHRYRRRLPGGGAAPAE